MRRVGILVKTNKKFRIKLRKCNLVHIKFDLKMKIFLSKNCIGIFMLGIPYTTSINIVNSFVYILMFASTEQILPENPTI